MELPGEPKGMERAAGRATNAPSQPNPTRAGGDVGAIPGGSPQAASRGHHHHSLAEPSVLLATQFASEGYKESALTLGSAIVESVRR